MSFPQSPLEERHGSFDDVGGEFQCKKSYEEFQESFKCEQSVGDPGAAGDDLLIPGSSVNQECGARIQVKQGQKPITCDRNAPVTYIVILHNVVNFELSRMF